MTVVFGGNGQLGRELARAVQRGIPMETLSVEVDIANSSAVASALSRIEPMLVVNATAYTKTVAVAHPGVSATTAVRMSSTTLMAEK